MIKIALCDTSAQVLAKYNNWIEYWQKKANILCNIQTFQSTNELISHFIRISSLDILIMDPSINHDSGILTVKKLRELNCDAEVIYFATSDKHLLEAFDTDPLYYQKKAEVTLDTFGKIFLRAVEKAKTKQLSNNIFSIRSGTAIKRIPYDLISHFEINNRVVTMYYDSQKSLNFYSTIAALLDQLNPNSFLRIHRSIIVNPLHIKSANRTSVTLLNGKQLPVGITYSQLLLNTLPQAAVQHAK